MKMVQPYTGFSPQQLATRDALGRRAMTKAAQPRNVGGWAGVLAQGISGLDAGLERRHASNAIQDATQQQVAYYQSELPDASPELQGAMGYDINLAKQELVAKRAAEAANLAHQRRMSLESHKAALDNMGAGGMGPISKGQEYMDRAFGKDAAAWAGKDAEDARTNINNVRQLEQQISDDVAAGRDVSGFFPGLAMEWAPGAVANKLYPGAVEAKRRMGQVIQQALRATLGAQFAYREGDQLLERAWDPAADESTNIQNVRALLDDMIRRESRMSSMTQHFDRFGTTRGYQAPNVTTPYGRQTDTYDLHGAPINQVPTADDIRNRSTEELEAIANGG